VNTTTKAPDALDRLRLAVLLGLRPAVLASSHRVDRAGPFQSHPRSLIKQPIWVGLKGAERSANPADVSTAGAEGGAERSEAREPNAQGLSWW